MTKERLKFSLVLYVPRCWAFYSLSSQDLSSHCSEESVRLRVLLLVCVTPVFVAKSSTYYAGGAFSSLLRLKGPINSSKKTSPDGLVVALGRPTEG